MLRNLLKKHFTNCLVIHPVRITLSHRRVTKDDIYAAEEAVGLAESLNWENKPGPFTNYVFDEMMIFDEERAKIIDENNMPDDLEVDQPVNLLNQKAIYQGANYFKIIFNPETKTDNSQTVDEDEQRYSFAQSHVVKCKSFSRFYYFQKYLLKSIKKFIILNNIEMLFIDDFLTNLQLRNIKKMMSGEITLDDKNTKPEEQQYENISSFINVVDRLGMILEIFNRRARSEITKLQVALVYLKYAKTLFVKEDDYFATVADIYNFNVTKPHQVNVQIASAKQSGRRYSVSGEGESQREMQNRIMKHVEKTINERLRKATENQKVSLEKSNKQKNLITVALIGYTNAGKSAVLNLFANSEIVESKDCLFQTLYTVTRRVKIRGNFEILLVDTIGFISNLPHDLLPTFVSTLEHLKSADIILHIRDISHPQTEMQNQVVIDVIKKVGISEEVISNKMIEVRNKIDLLEKRKEDFQLEDTESIVNISATSKVNIEKFRGMIISRIYKIFGCFEFKFKHNFESHEERILWLKEFVKKKREY